MPSRRKAIPPVRTRASRETAARKSLRDDVNIVRVERHAGLDLGDRDRGAGAAGGAVVERAAGGVEVETLAGRGETRVGRRPEYRGHVLVHRQSAAETARRHLDLVGAGRVAE